MAKIHHFHSRGFRRRYIPILLDEARSALWLFYKTPSNIGIIPCFSYFWWNTWSDPEVWVNHQSQVSLELLEEGDVAEPLEQ